jgi:ethanolamine phosphate transferase 2 subunit G
VKLLVHSNFKAKNPQKGQKPTRKWVQKELDHLVPPESSAAATSVSNSDAKSPFFNHIALLTLFTSTSLLAIMVACTLLRTHLFIWTVFSPKYLFAMAWTLAFHFFISIGVGGALWWVCGGKEEE